MEVVSERRAPITIEVLVLIDLGTYQVRPVGEERRAEEIYDGRLTPSITQVTPLQTHRRHGPCEFSDRSQPFFLLRQKSHCY